MARQNGGEGNWSVFVVTQPENWREKAEEKRREEVEGRQINFIGFELHFLFTFITAL